MGVSFYENELRDADKRIYEEKKRWGKFDVYFFQEMKPHEINI
jgi:hypothetical protein